MKMKERKPIVTIVKCLIVAYLLTGILLLILAFILYQFGLTEKNASIAIIVIYTAVTFVAGFLAGKLLHNRKFLWGMTVGVAYFIILLLVSLLVNGMPVQFSDDLLTTLVLCAGGGMLGGMFS